ncbi:hypothetical protein AUK11_03700 [bacterium CG2_30_37_16]|nr:MAG: hypothetical protein AUK11_03700 [bacterium CG2_30_37_16]PIP31129.1 MAG: hypothetical protein COX25_01030 [bacterium (Candidatus Howlettbacteria) CG23_combo_of_CG06-09_8_20_14_all_37_9]PIY00246.1 MAG: hypothetical protein COZ22_00710 [bacterium (Candidatus Howlettbacteria) CG_4_10_14_3_um_filter_37_10]PJB06060.1 MAG: hypothetical protein CO123_02870 [bacterium (Candidatus Howlettbacteria) CG_4_9_14_3_um_filter_37_10]
MNKKISLKTVNIILVFSFLVGAIGIFWTWHGNTNSSAAKDMAVKGAYTVAHPSSNEIFIWQGEVNTEQNSSSLKMPKESYRPFSSFLLDNNIITVKKENGDSMTVSIESFDADCPDDNCKSDWQLNLSPEITSFLNSDGQIKLVFVQPKLIN